MRSETLVVLAALTGVVVLAILSTYAVGHRAARTVEQVTDLFQRNEARFQAMVRDSTDIMAILGTDGTLVYTSSATERLLGLSTDSLLGVNLFTLIHPDDRALAQQWFGVLVELPADADRVEFRMKRSDGGWRLVEVVGTNLLSDPDVQGIVVSARDITDRRRVESDLREAQERFRSAFEHAPIGMALISLEGRVFRVNRALVEIIGRGEHDLLRASLDDLMHADHRVASHEAITRLVSGGAPTARIEQRWIHRDGHEVWVSLSLSLVRNVDHQPLYFVVQVEDITERRASGEALAHAAAHDPLTGLANRALFVDRLQRELDHAATRGERVAVLFLDLDRFKVVNDSLGHSAGDRLLVAVADRLSATMKPTDVVARFGGDEFVILCRQVSSEETAELVAERLAQTVAQPVTLVEGEVFVTASIGIAISGSGAGSGSGEDSPETLLRDADAAMYAAKQNGRDRSELFDPPTHHRVVDDLRTGTALHRALERGELRLHYQPILELSRGTLAGFEALIRWEHPERGLVAPNEFIPLAEETGLIVPLGTWALETACRQVVRWQDVMQRERPLSMSVNLSPRQLAEQSLPNDVARIIAATSMDPDALWLEITESTLMHDTESALSALRALRSLGLHLSVDDFGTGYSSLSYLERFPVDALKIDRSFIDGVGEHAGSTAITTAVVSLAHALGLRAVAEGIETREQLFRLRAMGCELGQGYLFSKPQPAEFYGDDPAAALRSRLRAESRSTLAAPASVGSPPGTFAGPDPTVEPQPLVTSQAESVGTEATATP